MTRKENIDYLKAQCQTMLKMEIELRKRREKLEKQLEKLKDEEQLEKVGAIKCKSGTDIF